MLRTLSPDEQTSIVLSLSKWLTFEEFLTEFPEQNLENSGLIRIEQWKENRLIFTIVSDHTELIPVYVVDNSGYPKPIIKDILDLFHGKKSALKIAAWFCSKNSWLHGDDPAHALDLLSPDILRNAARIETSPIDHG